VGKTPHHRQYWGRGKKEEDEQEEEGQGTRQPSEISNKKPLSNKEKQIQDTP
jgi:hypothetical protein